MADVHDSVGRLLGRALARREWGQIPDLAVVRADSSGPALVRVPVPPQIWAAAERGGATVGRVLASIAHVIAQSPDGRIREVMREMCGAARMFGVAFCCGVHGVMAEEGTAEASEMAAAALGHRLHTLPEATRYQAAYAVDVDGFTYLGLQPDGGPRADVFLFGPEDVATAPTGWVLASLDELLAGVAGVPVPARPGGWRLWRSRRCPAAATTRGRKKERGATSTASRPRLPPASRFTR